MSLFDRLYNSTVENGEHVNALLDEAFRKEYPNLHDFIVVLSNAGIPREHGRITITASNGEFQVGLADPTGQCSFSIKAHSVEAGLQSMEQHCAQGAVHWYQWPSRKKGGKKGRPTHSPSRGDS